jgi:5-enolpyruvylshikimate-3-phosphate synthase
MEFKGVETVDYSMNITVDESGHYYVITWEESPDAETIAVVSCLDHAGLSKKIDEIRQFWTKEANRISTAAGEIDKFVEGLAAHLEPKSEE